MERLIYKLQRLSKWSITIIAGIVFCVSVIVYILVTQKLVKPATSSEALEFLLAYTSEYIWALLLGLVAKVVPFAFLLVAIGSLINYLGNDYLDNNFMKMGIINVAAFVATMIIQASLVKYWGSIAIVAIVIMFLIYALINIE